MAWIETQRPRSMHAWRAWKKATTRARKQSNNSPLRPPWELRSRAPLLPQQALLGKTERWTEQKQCCGPQRGAGTKRKPRVPLAAGHQPTPVAHPDNLPLGAVLRLTSNTANLAATNALRSRV